MSLYCSKCGSELKADAAYCSNCGASVSPKTKIDTRNLVEVYKDAIKNYAKFSGRASVREYWMFFLANFLIYFIGLFVCFASAFSSPKLAVGLFFLLTVGYSLFIFLPSLSMAIRRLHDQDYPGILWLVSWVPVLGTTIFIVLMCLPGTVGENRYGSID